MHHKNNESIHSHGVMDVMMMEVLREILGGVVREQTWEEEEGEKEGREGG